MSTSQKQKITTKRTMKVGEIKISRYKESQLVGTQVLQIDDHTPQKELIGQD